VGPRAVLDALVKRKITSPRRESNPRTPIIQPDATRVHTHEGGTFHEITITVNIILYYQQKEET
jgi:hypothetical protein